MSVADIDSVVIVGRLTRDAELKYTTGGTACGKLGLAVNRRRKKDGQWVDEVHFFDVVIWGKTAEALKQYLTKGTRIAVKGELTQSRWEQDGKQRSRVEIVAGSVQLLGDGKAGKSTGTAQPVDGNPSDDFEDDFPG